MPVVINGSTGISSPGGDTSTSLATTTLTATTINNLTVGRGAGAVSTNTAVGASALAANSTGGLTTAVGFEAAKVATAGDLDAFGYQALKANTTGGSNSAFGTIALFSNTTGGGNIAVGRAALYANTTGSYNTALGRSALEANTTASNNTAVGYQAGYSATTNGFNTFVGWKAGYSSTAAGNSVNCFIGEEAGYYVTSGTKNTIIGSYNGNQGGLDIRTSSNYIVLSDGDGNPRAWYQYSNSTVGGWRMNSHSALNSTDTTFVISNASSADVVFEAGNATPYSSASSVIRMSKMGSNNRSLSASGTVNQNGADYAEYMMKSGDFTLAKGDVVGINEDGKLTNVFAEAIAFCVKSTDPGLVGNDTWFTEARPKDSSGKEVLSDTQEYAEWMVRHEIARATVDRIAFCGQVPVNVTGATAGQYIIPVNDNGAIKGAAVSNPTFEQYQQAVGKVIAIEQDGRAKIIVKVA